MEKVSKSQLGDDDMGQKSERGEGAPGRGLADQRLGCRKKPVSPKELHGSIGPRRKNWVSGQGPDPKGP